MKTFKQFLKEDTSSITNEMKNHFINRTSKHIELVNKYLNKINDLNLPEIITAVLFDNHDASKFEEPELTPYIYINWYYHCKNNNIPYTIPNDMATKCNLASFYHDKNNPHHPEFWDNNYDELKILDKGIKYVVDATSMPFSNIAQMIADWTAMDEELNPEKEKPSAKEWADKNINIKWKFTPEQIKFIYKLIDLINNIK